MRLALLLCLLPPLALAGAPRWNCETVTISTSACPTGSPGVDADGDKYGIGTLDLRAYKVLICPVTASAYITGAAGSVKFCAYSDATFVASGMTGWALAPQFTYTLTTSDATTADNPCLRLGDTEILAHMSGDRVYPYVSTDFAVSAGTQVKVCIQGEAIQ